MSDEMFVKELYNFAQDFKWMCRAYPGCKGCPLEERDCGVALLGIAETEESLQRIVDEVEKFKRSCARSEDTAEDRVLFDGEKWEGDAHDKL